MDDRENGNGDGYDLVNRLNRDLKNAARNLSESEVRYIVDLYYQMQEYRKRAANQGRAASKSGEKTEPHDLVTWATDQFKVLEGQIKRAMLEYAENQTAGKWCLSIHGVGPVITAGLLAHLSVHPWKCAIVQKGKTQKKCSEDKPHGPACHKLIVGTAGGFWRFAGLDPTLEWKKGQRRPWNARLKTLCWKISDSFVKHQNSDKDFYGKLYRHRKAYEVERNESGGNAETARKTLLKKNFRDPDTRARYEEGKLPDGRIDLMARRWTVKLFLSHLHQVMYEVEFGQAPADPYAVSILGHADIIRPPYWGTTSR